MATFATYIYTTKEHKFDPQTAFVATTLFNILRFGLNVAPFIFMETIKSAVSIRRIHNYLNADELDTSAVTYSKNGAFRT